MAAANGQLEAMKILFDYSETNKVALNINIQNSGGNTAVHWCVLNNKPETLKFLISKKADCNIKNAQNLVPVEMALDALRSDMIDILAEHTIYDESVDEILEEDK